MTYVALNKINIYKNSHLSNLYTHIKMFCGLEIIQVAAHNPNIYTLHLTTIVCKNVLEIVSTHLPCLFPPSPLNNVDFF